MPTGDFGKISEAYEKGRRGYPPPVLDFCFSRYQGGEILDIGCGTGISTRQLKNHVGNEKVVGVDVDIEMLKKAEMHTSDISYVEASAETLPFEENTFALVTAFGAFHWFANTESLTEIFRVLKPEGSFCIINKQNRFKDDLKKIVTEYGGVTLPDIKEKYAPASLLAEFGVSGVEERVFTMDDPYTPEEARGYYTSLSFSNYVPADKKESTEEKVMEYFLSITNQEGIIEGTTNITVVLAGGKEFMV